VRIQKKQSPTSGVEHSGPEPVKLLFTVVDPLELFHSEKLVCSYVLSQTTVLLSLSAKSLCLFLEIVFLHFFTGLKTCRFKAIQSHTRAMIPLG